MERGRQKHLVNHADMVLMKLKRKSLGYRPRFTDIEPSE